MTPIDLATLAQGFVDPQQDRAVKRGYLRWFAGAARVLDLGCGHGAFLAVARAAGLDAIGCDASPAAIAACRAAGFTAEVGDAEAVLRRGEHGADAMLCAHVVEHLPPAQVASLLAAIAAALAPGRHAVVVTPNVRNLIVLQETFWLDPTHLRPYPRPLLERLGRAAGLEVAASYDDASTRPRRAGIKRLLAWLRSRASGAERSSAMDAVVVFTKH